MVKTVLESFDEFMSNCVNLDKEVVAAARKSRDNLLENISEFVDEDFFKLCSDYNVHFGSFARKTKCRELDDIDLMIGISAEGALYNNYDKWDDVHIIASQTSAAQIACTRNDGTLNSTQVVNLFKSKLQHVREYSHSDIRKDHEAIVLNLLSKVWSFDIVPCFYTVPDADGRSNYLIPNGKGQWKKTNPKIDGERISYINQQQEGRTLSLIRLVKYWCKHSVSVTIPSYYLEALVLCFCENHLVDKYIDIAFQDVVNYIQYHVYDYIADPKGIQGNINTLEIAQMQLLRQRAQEAYSNACKAEEYEDAGYIEMAIDCWGRIFGNAFPKYK